MRGRTYLRLGRVSNLPTVWTNVLAGVVLAGGAPEPRVLLPLLVACSCFYLGGMFLNDAFDREHDAREKPHRPIPAGDARAFEVFAIGFALLGIGVATVGLSAALAGRNALKPLASGASLGAVVVAYDVWHRENPLSPLLMAGWRVLIYVTTALVIAGTMPTPVIIGAACLFAYLVGLSRAAHDNDGAFSWSHPLLFVPLLPTLALVRDVAGVVIWVGFLAWTVTQLGAILARRGAAANAGLLAGVSLLDAAFIAHAGQPFLGMVAAIGFAATLGLQRYVRS